MNDSTVRRLVMDYSIALGAGMLASLTAFLARAHQITVLSAGVLICAAISTVIGMISVRRRRPPLKLRIKSNPEWRILDQTSRRVAFEVEVSNKTRDTIAIQSYSFTYQYPGGSSQTAEIGDDDMSHHYPRLDHYSEVLAHKSISGWCVAKVNHNPAGGAPSCTIVVKDIFYNTYQLTIPAQEPQIYL